MAKKEQEFDPRKYMEQAIEVMLQSVSEPRDDKISPKVGAVLIKPDGSVETASRGELRYGDHAEFTLLERKNRGELLEGSLLFATLEPCAPGARKHPKLGCAERIVNARIKKVWVGIEDPDPTVDRKGIQYLLDHGIEVEMFDSDLQSRIREENKEFIEQAEERAKEEKEKKTRKVVLSPKEKAETKVNLDDLAEGEVSAFIQKAKLGVEIGTEDFKRRFAQLGLLQKVDNEFVPTGLGLLLFGERPQLTYPGAIIRATLKRSDGKEEIATIEGSLPRQVDQIQSWYETKMGSHIDRSRAARQIIYDYPMVVFREAIINAIVHRDYDIEGAPIYFEINQDAIIVKSPGEPVPPISLEKLKRFDAPSLSRNPKIMYVFDQLNLVEQRGLGFQTIKSLRDEFNIPLPIISYEAPYMTMTFPRHGEGLRHISPDEAISQLSDSELKGYDWIRSQKEVSTKAYAEYMEIAQRTASRHLAKMLELGLLTTNEEETKSPKLRYRVDT